MVGIIARKYAEGNQYGAGFCLHETSPLSLNARQDEDSFICVFPGRVLFKFGYLQCAFCSSAHRLHGSGLARCIAQGLLFPIHMNQLPPIMTPLIEIRERPKEISD